MQAGFDGEARGILRRFAIETFIFARQSTLGKGRDHILQKGFVDFSAIFNKFGGCHEMISRARKHLVMCHLQRQSAL